MKEKHSDDESVLMPPMEAGDIGDEQLPAGESKTDKAEWSYTADRVKKRILPEKVREFLNGL